MGTEQPIPGDANTRGCAVAALLLLGSGLGVLIGMAEVVKAVLS